MSAERVVGFLVRLTLAVTLGGAIVQALRLALAATR